jgi:hypothetical protein
MGDAEDSPLMSRRAVSVALAGAAAGMVGASVLADRGRRAAPLAAHPAAGEAELTAVEHVDAVSASTYRLFGGRKGPATATPTGKKGLLTGLVFEVKSGGCWLDGYWWWVCDRGQSTKPQTFTLWMPYPTKDAPKGKIVPGTTVTSKKLVPGRWNFIPLKQAVPLSIATWYMVETGSVGGVPVTGNLWGARHPWAKGESSGPLFAPPTGPNGIGQCPVTVGSNPTKVMPIYGGYPADAFYWLDLQVTTKAASGASYRLWPSMPLVAATPKTAPDTTEQSFGTEFWLSDAYPKYKLDKIWFWSPIANAASGLPAAKLLPSSCAIFDIATQAAVGGTMRGTAGPDPAVMPDWRTSTGTQAKPGDGWVYCAYDGVTLAPGRYKTAVYCYAGGIKQSIDYLFFEEQRFYFGPDGSQPASAPEGITNGPLYSPPATKAALANSNGTVPSAPGRVHGNSTYQLNDSTNTGTFLYPDTFDNSDNGETRWVDVEVTPVPKPKPKPK